MANISIEEEMFAQPQEVNITIEEEMFAQLQEAKRRLASMGSGKHQTLHPKIQRVPHHLRNRKHFAKYYSPRLVSFGPIHHGEPNLELGEQYKLMWARIYIDGLHKCATYLYQKIADNIKELKHLYTEDAIRHFDEPKLACMLFVDGCALHQILSKFDLQKSEELNVKVDQLVLVNQDVLLLENQLPFQVLKLLSDKNMTELKETMDKFISCHHFSKEKPNRTGDQSPPPHLLDHLRRAVLLHFHGEPKTAESVTTYRNIRELKAAGIGVKKSNSLCQIDISFSSNLFGGELKLPRITVDDTMGPTYLNVIAYEMCPDFENKYEISSYVEFLDSLIDHPDDVKELRSAGVLHNGLGSDEEVAKLYNTISADVVPDTKIYASVRSEIEKHYKKKYKTWLAQAYHTYFSSPWTIIAFLAAFLVLLLTFIQTWFTVFHSK